jgi:hypothetical protein
VHCEAASLVAVANPRRGDVCVVSRRNRSIGFDHLDVHLTADLETFILQEQTDKVARLCESEAPPRIFPIEAGDRYRNSA